MARHGGVADNSLDGFACMQWLVALQAAFTVIGNIGLWWGAYHVFKQSQAQSTEAS